jgi:hypothetical protein
MSSRVGSATSLGIHRLDAHSLRFHKIGKDGSGKCDAYFTSDPADCIWGVVYTFKQEDKEILDRIEGLGKGYREQSVLVYDPGGIAVTAFTYIALKTDPLLKPFVWYKNHVLTGALEANLPEFYVSQLTEVEAIDDQDAHRKARELSIYKPGLRGSDKNEPPRS